MTLTFTLKGQCRSGKNNMGVPRNGRHYPLPEWAAWRDEMVLAVKQQIPCVQTRSFKVMGIPYINDYCKATIVFTHADKRRRDIPGMLDALCHVLERAGVVKDDSLIVDWDVHTVPEPNKAKAGVEIRLETLQRAWRRPIERAVWIAPTRSRLARRMVVSGVVRHAQRK